MDNQKISCQCKNSIKLKIIQFITNNDHCILIDNAVEHMLIIIKAEIQDILDLNDAFLKSYIRALITELINEKIICSSEIKVNEKLGSNDYYYMQFTESTKDIFNHTPAIQEKAGAPTESIKQEKEHKDNNIHQAKVDELLRLKKTLEKTKKESKAQELIRILHKYNELKDIAQELLGRIASEKNIRIKELYEQLEISDDN